MLVVKFPGASFEVKRGLLHRILKHGGRVTWSEKWGMSNPLHFWIITIEGRDAQGNAMSYPAKKIFDQSTSTNSHGMLV